MPIAPGPGSPQRPSVSVVTIFLNGKQFLGEAIESVMAQTYPDWELLLVDDGSTDGSTDIALRWAELHPDRIRYIHHADHRNMGMSASRNLGVRESRGRYIAFLDADDVYLPNKIERQLALLESVPDAGMIYGATQYWHSWTGNAADRARDRARRQGIPGGTLTQPRSLLAGLVRDDVRTPCTCGVLMRRTAFESVGGFEERFTGMFEDQVFFFKVFARVPVLVDSGCYDRYRQHAASHSHVQHATGNWDPRGLPSAARGEFLQWVSDFVVAEGVSDPELDAALRRERRPYQSRIYRWMQRVGHHARHVSRRMSNATRNP